MQSSSSSSCSLLLLSSLAVAVAVAACLAAPALAADDTVHIPRFHFVPLPHNWMNDPNGLFYDPVFKKYHLMFQYQTPRVWGHAVSEDLVNWKNLPIAMENDQWYDKGGVFSGSATVLDDEAQTPVLSYSVSTNDMQCLAYPSNRSDPNLVQWTKFSGNPIISAKTGAMDGRDDTTAWKSGDGSTWRMAYGTDKGAVVYTSTNFQNWTLHGMLNNDDPTGMWECPDFFPLPGSRVYVLKASTLGRDFWTLGLYDDDTIRFSRITADMGETTQLYDYGQFYASKRFHDPSTDSQVLFGWVNEERKINPVGALPYGWASVQSLPRLISLDSDTRIRYDIPDAFQALRNASSLVTLKGLVVKNNTSYKISNLSGRQLELFATFDIASASQRTCQIDVLASNDMRERTSVGITVGATDGAFMSGIDLPGGDYNVTNVAYTDPRICQSVCLNDPNCLAWTYVKRPPLAGACCLKDSIPAQNPNPTCTSGVRDPGASSLYVFGSTINSSLNATDGHAATMRSGVIVPKPNAQLNAMDLHVFVDHSIVEVFAYNGRHALTRRAYPTLPDADNVFISAVGGDCELISLQAWEIKDAIIA